jgi:hypothetical protein
LIKLQKYKHELPDAKFFQTWHGGRPIQMGQLSFWEGDQIPNGFWIKNLGIQSNLNLVWIENGFKPFGKNP